MIPSQLIKVIFYVGILGVNLPIIHGYFSHNEGKNKKWYIIRTAISIIRYIAYIYLYRHILQLGYKVSKAVFETKDAEYAILHLSTVSIVLSTISTLIRRTKLSPTKYYILMAISISLELIYLYMFYREASIKRTEASGVKVLNKISVDQIEEVIDKSKHVDMLSTALKNKKYADMIDQVKKEILDQHNLKDISELGVIETMQLVSILKQKIASIPNSQDIANIISQLEEHINTYTSVVIRYAMNML